MKFVSTQNLNDSMVLAKAVYTADGRVLLNRGVLLQDRYIQRLQAMGLPGVYIVLEGLPHSDQPEPISPKTRQAAIDNIRGAFLDQRMGKTFSLEPVKDSVNSILDDIAANPHIMVNLTDVRAYDAYTFGHCVNVCVLCLLIGVRYGLNELDLRRLAMGAILHDVGKIVVPEPILNKPGRLTDEEMAEMRNHPDYGWQVLRQHKELPLASAHVAYQHHERPDGLGYPRGLKATQISLYAQICGVADAYDAMTSHRVYRKGMAPHKALTVIQSLKGRQFDPNLVDLFSLCLSPYPVGSVVKLNQGESGLVIALNNHHDHRPVVLITHDRHGERVAEPYSLDLAANLHYTIERIVDDE